MNKIAKLILSGEIKTEDLFEAEDLIKRVKLVRNGLDACKQTISFKIRGKESYLL